MLRIERSAWALAISSAILSIIIYPLLNWYVLSWVAITPLLIALVRAQPPNTLQFEGRRKLLPAPPLEAFLLGYAYGIVWYAGTCYWVYHTMKQYGGISPAGAAGLLILFCLYLGLYSGLFAVIISLFAKSSMRAALVLSPFAWVAVELARTRISGFPWDLLGITQVDNVPLARIARVTGVYGISFEIMVVNAAFAAAFVARSNRRRSMLVAALGAALVLESARWIPLPALPADRLSVLVQENIPILDSSDWTPQFFEVTLSDLSRISQMTSPDEHRHPDLIVWPESPAPFYSQDPLFHTVVTQLARGAEAWVVVGMIGTDTKSQAAQSAPEVFNSAVLVSPQGGWTERYDKVHLVPFGEYVPFKRWLGFAGGLTKEVGDFTPGASRRVLHAGQDTLGVFICYESIFPDEVRQFANQGAQLLINISNDGWYGDSGAYAQHLRQARMRALENDRWLLRATNTGVTAAIDPYGRIVQRVPRKVRTALDAAYSLNNLTTFYTRHGDWLAYGCAIICLGAMLVSITPSKARSV